VPIFLGARIIQQLTSYGDSFGKLVSAVPHTDISIKNLKSSSNMPYSQQSFATKYQTVKLFAVCRSSSPCSVEG
jgi:hypothetical protein